MLSTLQIVQGDAVVVQHFQHVLPVVLRDPDARRGEDVVSYLTKHQMKRQRAVQRLVGGEHLLLHPQRPRHPVVREMSRRRLRVKLRVDHLLHLFYLGLVRRWHHRSQELGPFLDLDPLHLVGAMGRGDAGSSVHVAVQLLEALTSSGERLSRVGHQAKVSRRRHAEAVPRLWRHVPGHPEGISLRARVLEYVTRVLGIEDVGAQVATRVKVGAPVSGRAGEIRAVLPVKVLGLLILRSRLVKVVSVLVVLSQVLLRREYVPALAEHVALGLGEMVERLGVGGRSEGIARLRLDRHRGRPRLRYTRLTEQKGNFNVAKVLVNLEKFSLYLLQIEQSYLIFYKFSIEAKVIEFHSDKITRH